MPATSRGSAPADGTPLANGSAAVGQAAQSNAGQAAGGAAMDGGPWEDQQLHDALYSDPAKLTQPINTVEDKFQLLPAFLKVRR